MKRLALLFALLLAGCDIYQPAIRFEADAAPNTPSDDGVWTIAVGTGIAVAPYITQDEIEGGPSPLEADDVDSADPTIASVTKTSRFEDLGIDTKTRVVIVTGLRPGATQIRIYRGGDHEDVNVRVVQP